MKARNLSLLRIDDRLALRRSNTSTAPADYVGKPPKGIDLVTFQAGGEPCLTVGGWTLAIHFWSQFDPRSVPDLVVGDVHFDEDASTPMNFDEYGIASRSVPTGLSHVKPFAAVARALGSPMGIGVHTADPDLWRRACEQIGDRAYDPRMGLLAAHEIGEIAAILGDEVDIEHLPHADQLAWCWQWLTERSERGFDEACSVALTEYRRKLVQCADPEGLSPAFPSVYVMPDEWALLLKWCNEMQADAVPLPKNDPGLPLVFADGRRDLVSLASIFADVPNGKLHSRPLPPKCYDIAEAGGPWELDADSLPCIGGLIKRLGFLSDAYGAAVRAIGNFPIDLKPDDKLNCNLRDVVQGGGSGKFVRGLAVLFHVLRRDHENLLRWQEACERLTWLPGSLSCEDTGAGGESLKGLLHLVCQIARGLGDWFTLEEIFEDQTDARTAFAGVSRSHRKWHLDLLVAAGALEYRHNVEDGCDEYTYTAPLSEIIPVPEHLPGLPEARDFVGRNFKAYLRNALGFGKTHGPNTTDDEGVIGQLLANAFGLAGQRQGRDLLDRFLQGEGPSWLIELCRRYLRDELAWSDERTWPQAVRPS